MATLKDIRKRISSVRNTQKITRAMKMVAASKLRRSQQALVAARPYTDHMAKLVGHLAALESDHPAHPLLVKRENVARVRLIVLTSDRGFCGGFNGNLLRRTWGWLWEKQEAAQAIDLHIIGRKGREFLRARNHELQQFESQVYEGFDFGQARRRAEQLIADYEAGQFDECYMVYNRFKSAIAQVVTFQKLIPIEPLPLLCKEGLPPEADPPLAEGEVDSGSTPPQSSPYKGEDVHGEQSEYIPDYIYEPAAPRLLAELLPRYLATDILRNFLESIASEFGARMVAMDAATNNCSDMIDRLTMTGNRLRQAAITSELMDIVNGAEALK